MNMTPVGGGWTSHTIRGDGDYEAQKASSIGSHKASTTSTFKVSKLAVQSGGDVIKDSRSKYGNVNIMPQQIDPSSNFAQKDAPGSMILDDQLLTRLLVNSLETSATKTQTNRDPQGV